MDSGEVASIVTIVGMVLSWIGVTNVDPSLISGAVTGCFAIVTFGAALWSWYIHRQKNNAVLQ